MRKIKLLFDYLLVDDKITLKEERLMGFPWTPKQVEKLVHEAILELYQLEADAELGRAVRKAFGQSRGVLYIAPIYGVSPGRVIIDDFDAQITCVETLLEWAKGVSDGY